MKQNKFIFINLNKSSTVLLKLTLCVRYIDMFMYVFVCVYKHEIIKRTNNNNNNCDSYHSYQWEFAPHNIYSNKIIRFPQSNTI